MFETALRHRLIEDSRSHHGMRGYLTALVANNKYPERLNTPYKVFVLLNAVSPEDLKTFRESHKGKVENMSDVEVSNMFFLQTMSRICADYGINMTELAKK